jgi:hypothetical protein
VAGIPRLKWEPVPPTCADAAVAAKLMQIVTQRTERSFIMMLSSKRERITRASEDMFGLKRI